MEQPAINAEQPEIMVQPDELRRFGQLLADQAQGLRRKTRDLEVIGQLTADGSPLGSFPEALLLADANRQAVGLMDALIAQISGAVEFADSVATVTGNSFQQLDAEAESEFVRIDAGPSPTFGSQP